MHFYHIIPLKTEARWFTPERIFYFQLGKRRKHELLVEQHYQEITQKCSEHGFTFVFHKHLVDNIDQLNKQDKDYPFFNKIAGIPEQQYYEELDWQSFDTNEMDPVYIVRRYNEEYLIVWGYHAFQSDRNKTLRFPFESLESLENIIIGDNCQFNPHSQLQPPTNDPVKTPSTHPDSFLSAFYRCICSHETEIFIENDYNIYNLLDAEGYCSCCMQEKEDICSGDLIFRKDWPDPDDPPWQMQCAYIPEGTGFCRGCEANYKNDYRVLRISCSICDGDMIYIDSNKL